MSLSGAHAHALAFSDSSSRVHTIFATIGPNLAPKASLPMVSCTACGLGSAW